MAAPPAPSRPGFKFRRLDKPEEFRAAAELQVKSAGGAEELVAAPGLLREVQDHGGMVLGAFADIYLAGVSAGVLGWDGTQLYHFSHVTAVRPEYQNHHLGFQLGAYLREEVLLQGLPVVRTTIDPLRSRAAHLAIRRLGAMPERYHPHYFGQLERGGGAGSESDRLRLRWELATPRTEQRLAGTVPAPEEDRARFARSSAIVETELSEEGFRRPTSVTEPDSGEAHLEIPFDLDAVEEHAPALLRAWRHAVRDAFRAAFDVGYTADDFVTLSIDHERRGFYLLRRDRASPPSAPPAASA